MEDLHSTNTNHPNGTHPASGPYAVIIGAGGAGSYMPNGGTGVDTTFGSSPQPAYLGAKGGG